MIWRQNARRLPPTGATPSPYPLTRLPVGAYLLVIHQQKALDAPALNLTSKSGSRNPIQPVYEFTVNPFTSLKVPHSVIHQEKALYEPVQNPEKNLINPDKSGKTSQENPVLTRFPCQQNAIETGFCILKPCSSSIQKQNYFWLMITHYITH